MHSFCNTTNTWMGTGVHAQAGAHVPECLEMRHCPVANIHMIAWRQTNRLAVQTHCLAIPTRSELLVAACLGTLSALKPPRIHPLLLLLLLLSYVASM